MASSSSASAPTSTARPQTTGQKTSSSPACPKTGKDLGCIEDSRSNFRRFCGSLLSYALPVTFYATVFRPFTQHASTIRVLRRPPSHPFLTQKVDFATTISSMPTYEYVCEKCGHQ